jgi:hypothetical protein
MASALRCIKSKHIHAFKETYSTTSTESHNASEATRTDKEAFEIEISANTRRVNRVPTNIMLSDPAATAITGAAFGASLAASGVYLPSVIIDQFRLTDFHMFHVFATAVGSSA